IKTSTYVNKKSSKQVRIPPLAGRTFRKDHEYHAANNLLRKDLLDADPAPKSISKSKCYAMAHLRRYLTPAIKRKENRVNLMLCGLTWIIHPEFHKAGYLTSDMNRRA